jgi:hypothetical protein
MELLAWRIGEGELGFSSKVIRGLWFHGVLYTLGEYLAQVMPRGIGFIVLRDIGL